ncbi:MAG TPA: alpha/beta fold hydrolase [Rhodanobacteraceae bacterium]|nr:alpha/beta fold hydrolase [Rhodanobacteraceae bacterium]
MLLLGPSQKSTVVRTKAAPAWVRAGFSVASWLAPDVAIARAVELFCTPSRTARRRAIEASTAFAATLTLDVGGRNIEVYRWGDPSAQPYVLVVHGWSDYALRFVPLIDALRDAGYAVVTFDQPGHGRSDGDTSTLPEFARCVGAVGRHFGRAAAVVGHSMGGAAAAIALRDGLAADRAILIAPPADLADAADRFAAFVGLAPHLRERFHRALEERASVRFESLEAHRNVPAIDRPALIVHDLCDREVPWSEGERYARYWPRARMVSTANLGHNRILADAGVVGTLLDFLRDRCVGERVVSTPDLPFGFA